MKKGEFLSIILKSNKTVFSFKEILLMWKETNIYTAKTRINYYVKNQQLIQLRRGLYAKDRNYDKYELATKIYIPTYISFETVLQQNGLIFQKYNSIFMASYKTKELEIDNQNYCFRAIKRDILINQLGVEKKENYHIASSERAFLDVLYLNNDYYFDNLSLDWNRVNQLLLIYNNKRMNRKIKELELLNKKIK